MPKLNIQEYHIYDYIYQINIILTIGCKEETSKVLKQKYNIELDFGEHSAGYTEMCKGNIFIWLEGFNNSTSAYSNFVHEIFHATAYILDSRGVKFSVHNDEPYAYYLGFLIKEFLIMIRNKRS